MAQFEEQCTAAKVVTPFTRPLNLYYGLAQAGMAIAAAHAPDPWSFSRHGLKLPDRNAGLADMQVRPDGDGAFQKVASATGSPGINGPVSIGALWASIPSLVRTATLPNLSHPVALDVIPEESHLENPRAILYIPGEMPTESEAWLARFTEILAEYPGTDDIRVPLEPGTVVAPNKAGKQWQITVEWPAPDVTRAMTEEELRLFFGRIAPPYLYEVDRALRPRIGASEDAPPSPLMTWWLLLYSFSILARYEPRRWVAMLDLDKSGAAISLQYLLEEALTVVPHLVLEALDGEPYLLSRPMMF